MKATIALLTAGLLVSGTAFAKPHKHYDYAKVITAEPITRYVQVSTPRQECWDERVAHYDDRGYRSATPTLLGSVIGGAIGNELGNHKDAKRAGVLVGAILGGSIGRDIGQRTARPSRSYYTTEQVCETYQEYHEEQRIVGYHVRYRYRGEVYSTETDHHPGDRIKVSVSVIPVDGLRRGPRYRD